MSKTSLSLIYSLIYHLVHRNFYISLESIFYIVSIKCSMFFFNLWQHIKWKITTWHIKTFRYIEYVNRMCVHTKISPNMYRPIFFWRKYDGNNCFNPIDFSHLIRLVDRLIDLFIYFGGGLWGCEIPLNKILKERGQLPYHCFIQKII